jgi:hypothetical protein
MSPHSALSIDWWAGASAWPGVGCLPAGCISGGSRYFYPPTPANGQVHQLSGQAPISGAGL